jgi:hypothetical protein
VEWEEGHFGWGGVVGDDVYCELTGFGYFGSLVGG